MTKDELLFLFEKHLGRNFTEEEWRHHGKKIYSSFENEILNCEEKLSKVTRITSDDKIAILLTGHIRKNSILDGILKLIKTYNVDIFVHTWDNLGIKGTETDLKAKIDENFVITEIKKLPNVIKYKIENNKNYINSLEDYKGYFNFSSPEKFIKSQLYSINQACKFMEDHIVETSVDYSLV
jgi:hypothetical protein